MSTQGQRSAGPGPLPSRARSRPGRRVNAENGEGRKPRPLSFEEFADRYPRQPLRTLRFAPAQEKLLEVPRAYSAAFGTVLHDFLSGEPSVPRPDRFLAFLRDYDQWNARDFVHTVDGLEAPGTPERRVAPLMLMHFHTLTRDMSELWLKVLYGQKAPNRLRMREYQILIALHAWGVARARDDAFQAGSYFADENEPVRSVQSGILTESDLAVVLLNMMRLRPDLVVLPAPAQFESSLPSRNIDFLALDLSRRTILGLQVKTSVRNDDISHYTREGVVLIDGVVDLGNSRQLRTRANSSALSTVAWPGLITTHFLAKARLDGPGFRQYADRIAPKQRVAKRVTYGTRNYLPQAAAHVSERMIGRL